MNIGEDELICPDCKGLGCLYEVYFTLSDDYINRCKFFETLNGCNKRCANKCITCDGTGKIKWIDHFFIRRDVFKVSIENRDIIMNQRKRLLKQREKDKECDQWRKKKSLAQRVKV